MSRLVEPKPRGDSFHDASSGGDDYLARIAKYVPAEIVGAYLAGQGLITAATAENSTLRRVVFVIFAVLLWVLTPLYLRQQRQPGQPWRKNAAVGAAAFVVWVYALAELPSSFGLYNGLVAALILIVFTLASGLVAPVVGDK